MEETLKSQPGQRSRTYGTNAQKQQAYRVRQKVKKKEQLQAQWEVLPAGAQVHLVHLVDQYGEEAGQEALAAIRACFEGVEWSQFLALYRQWYQPFQLS